MVAGTQVAVIAGLGPGLGAALARELAEAGYQVVGLARHPAPADTGLDDLIEAGQVELEACDVTVEAQVEARFARIREELGEVRALIYNTGGLHKAALTETTAEAFTAQWQTQCLGAFLCARAAAGSMLEAEGGAILFSGATASIRPNAYFPAFGSAKSGLRGLAQSMARELGPQGIHVAHVVIDGVMWTPRTREMSGVTQERALDTRAVARTYRHLIEQERSAWTFELDLRPDVERF